MKTTFLVRDGLCQVVLHPETKAERAVLDLVSADQSVTVHRAQFAETQGGLVRQFGLGGHYGAVSDHLPDTVLVLRPMETSGTNVEPPPADVDLCRKSDGTWVYRNHAGTWQTCPPPFPPDRSYEVGQNKADFIAIRDIAAVSPARGHVATPDVVRNLAKIVEICTIALGGGATDPTKVGGGLD